MIANQKHLFDVPDDVTYLNCAAYSPFLKSVRAAGEVGLERKNQPWNFSTAILPAEAERMRQLFAGLIGAAAGDIAIVNSTAYGIATAAANIAVGRGQSIVVLKDQVPSNVYAWRRLAEKSGGIMRTVPRPADGGWTPRVLEAIANDTAVAALPPCHWTDGSRLDLVAIGERCREVGAALVVDATQAVGVMDMDMGAIQPDFLACSAYKWLLCPYTLAFLYAAPQRQDGTPLEHHRWNYGAPVAERTDTAYDDDYAQGAARFTMGEALNLINMPMAVAAMEQLTAWGPAAIQETLSLLTDAVAARAEERGWSVFAKANRVGHSIGVRPPEPPSSDLALKLRAENVHISLRGDAIRVSPHLYNDVSDIERLFAALDRTL